MIAANDDPAVPGAPRRLYVLGAVRVVVDDSAIALTGDAARLIAYLAIHRSRHQREVLSDRLWPGAGSAARRRLNDTLYRLGRTIGDGWLVKSSATVALADAVWVDATVFGRLCASDDREDVERGIDVYVGELAPGIYDEWVHEPREWHRNLLSRALGDVIAWCEADGEFEAALLHARRLVSIDSFDEGAHRAYLRALGRLHRYGEAAAHYDALVELLARELGVRPDAETTALVEQLAREREVAVDGAPDQTRLVGRARERRSAIEAVEAMFAGHGSVWCVQGPAGIGKSRLIDELVQSAGWRGATVLRGEVELTPEVSPLAPLAHALAPILTAPVRAQIESRLDVGSRRALAPVHPGWAGPSGSGSPDSPARSHAAFRVLGATLAGIEPTVLVIDDLHWADATLWHALDGFADGFVLGGGLVVGGFRYPEIEHGPGWERLQEWDRRGHATMCTLEPLTQGEVAELVGDLASAETVHAVTGGVPFYVEQWQRAPAGDRAGPDPIIESRLDALGPEARQALDGAAVLGGRVDFRAWTDVSGIASLELASISDHLVKDGWLTPTLDGCVFTHDILQAAVYDRIDSAERISLHRRAADAVARSQPNNTRTLAFHLDEAGARSAAAAAYRATAESQRAESAFDAAALAWSRALELLPASPPRERLDVALDLAEVCDVISDLTRQQPVLQEAIALARQLDDPGALLRLLKLAGGAAVRSGDIDVAETTLDEAAQLADSLADAPAQADILFRRGDLLIQTGRWARGDTHFAEGLQRLVPSENPWLYGRLLRGRAICAVRTGRAAEAAELLERALATFSDADDRLNEMVTLTSLFSAYYEQGAWDLLESATDRASPIARDLGDAVNIGLVHQARGLAALALGDRTAARNLMIECQRCFESAGRPRLVSSAINVRGLIAADNDEIDDAEALYSEAIAKASAVKATTEVAYVRHDLGTLLLQTRRANAAIDELRFAADHWAETGHPMLHAKSAACLGIAIIDAGGPPEEPTQIADAGLELLRSGAVTGEHPQAWLWHLAELLRRLDRPDHRADVVDAAHDELVRQAHAIEDPVRRRQFFELVPLNRSIAAAHAELDQRTTSAPTTARLARADAPLGRVLRADELVEVNLTVHTAADDAFDEPAKRRHRLRRLLTEADTQGAAPTDDQLAELLLVSRRTILRDMAALEREGVVTVTRRRRRRPASPNRGAGSPHP